MGPSPTKSIKVIAIVRTKNTTFKELASSKEITTKKLKRLLQVEISPRHSKWPLIDDMVVASTMTSEADRGAKSLARHQSEAPYCKEYRQ